MTHPTKNANPIVETNGEATNEPPREATPRPYSAPEIADYPRLASLTGDQIFTWGFS